MTRNFIINRLEVIVTVGLFVFIAWLMWWTGEYCRRLPMSDGPNFLQSSYARDNR